MDKVGAENNRLRNTASPFHTVLPIPPPTSLPSCSPPLPFSSTNPGGKERQKKFNFYFQRKKDTGKIIKTGEKSHATEFPTIRLSVKMYCLKPRHADILTTSRSVLRSQSIFDRLRLRVFFLAGSGSCSSEKVCFKKNKKDEQQYILQ